MVAEMKHKLNWRQRGLQSMLYSNYKAINMPQGKTSKEHKCLHKMWVNERIRLDKDKQLGRLDKLYSEVPYHNVPCGTDLTIRVGHQDYTAEIVYNTAHADSLEIYRDKHGQVYTRIIEVLPHHNFQAHFPNCKSGKIWANEFKDFMKYKGYFDEELYDSFKSQLGRDPPSNDCYNVGLKRYEYDFSPKFYNGVHEIQRQKITYSKFEPFVENESVLERKHRIYGTRGDSMSFVIFKEDLPAYMSDALTLADKLRAEEKPFNVDYLFTLKQKHFWEIVGHNGGLSKMSRTEEKIHIPKEIKRKTETEGLFQTFSIDDMLNTIYEEHPSDKTLIYNGLV